MIMGILHHGQRTKRMQNHEHFMNTEIVFLRAEGKREKVIFFILID